MANLDQINKHQRDPRPLMWALYTCLRIQHNNNMILRAWRWLDIEERSLQQQWGPN